MLKRRPLLLASLAVALLASPHLSEQFANIQFMFPAGLHAPWWLVLPLAAVLAGVLGLLLGVPTHKLNGDYLAVVTLAIGEIVRLFVVNMRHPVNLTNGAHGISQIDNIRFLGVDFGRPLDTVFGIGAAFGGVAGSMFATFQGFVSPESLTLQESIIVVAMVVLGGTGNIPGVILGAVLLSVLPQALRYVVGPLQAMTDGRLDAPIIRQLLVALAMIGRMLMRPRGLWPKPENGKATFQL